jgi:hypothetical protein
LAGRVPVKVSSINGDVKVGDYLTSSPIAGVAMKATKPGQVIGKAMQSFDCTSASAIENQQSTNSATADFGLITSAVSTVCQGTTLAFVSTGYYDPTPAIVAAAGGIENFVINKATDSAYYVSDIFGNTIENVGVFTSAAIGNLQVGVANIQELTSAHIISPIADISQVRTNLISPIGSDSAIALKFDNNKLSILNGNSASASAVTSFDNLGNATFSGSLKAASGQFGDASISGTLHAGKIIASEIEGLNSAISNQLQATSSPTYITNITNVYNSTTSSELASNFQPSASASAANGSLLAAGSYIDISSYSGLLAYLPDFTTDNLTVNQGLNVLGSSSFAQISVTDQLSVGGNFILANGAINVLGADLLIQPLRQGGLSAMAGLFYIDTNGNMKVGGNAEFAKDVTVKGTLAANVVAPIPGNDLTLDLSGNNPSSLVIKGTSGSGVLAINQTGDVTASGSGTFGKLNLSLIQPAFALSSTEVMATGSAGTAMIRAHYTEVTIDNPAVTDKSLIYLTPKTDQPIYLMRQNPGVSFTVGVSTILNVDVPFNWIIVN